MEDVQLGGKTQTMVAADAAWALIDAGMLARTVESVRTVALAVGVTVDDLRQASERRERLRGARRRPNPSLIAPPELEPPAPTVVPSTEVDPRLTGVLFHGSPAAFTARVREALDSRPAKSAPPVVAKQLVDDLDDAAMGDMVAWLTVRAPEIVAREMQRMLAGTGGHNQAAARSFAERAAKFELGDIEALTDFSITYIVDGTPKTLGEMTGPDHETVAAGFQQMGVRSLMLAAFHRAVARRIGPSRTDECFQQQGYATLLAQPVELPALTK